MDFRDLYTPGKVTFEESFPPAGWDPHERLAVMDSERIDVSVLYPTMGLFWEGWMGDDRDLLAAYCRAYNDWVWDFCATDARRLIPAGHVSLRNLDAAVAEVHRLANRGSARSSLRPTSSTGIGSANRCSILLARVRGGRTAGWTSRRGAAGA